MNHLMTHTYDSSYVSNIPIIVVYYSHHLFAVNNRVGKWHFGFGQEERNLIQTQVHSDFRLDQLELQEQTE